MTDPSPPSPGVGAQVLQFFARLLGDIVRQLAWFASAFAVGTGGTAIACWIYGLSMSLSLLGGLLVLGIALALAAM